MKELDCDTTQVVQWIEELRQPCRLRQVVIWIGGEQEAANRWAEKHGVTVAVLPAHSTDLEAWRVNPAHNVSVVFVENKMAIGTLQAIDQRDKAEFHRRLFRLGEAATEMKHGHASRWGRVIQRGLQVEPEPPPAMPPVPMRSDRPASNRL